MSVVCKSIVNKHFDVQKTFLSHKNLLYMEHSTNGRVSHFKASILTRTMWPIRLALWSLYFPFLGEPIEGTLCMAILFRSGNNWAEKLRQKAYVCCFLFFHFVE